MNAGNTLTNTIVIDLIYQVYFKCIQVVNMLECYNCLQPGITLDCSIDPVYLASNLCTCMWRLAITICCVV